MTIKLHVFPPSPRAFKVLAAAAYMRLDCEVHVLDLAKGEQKSPEFTALNPNQRMPVLEDEGFVLWESNAILQYLASKQPESALLPMDPVKRSLVSQWQCWDLAHWEPACAPIVFERFVKKAFNMGEPDAAEIAKGEERFHRCAKVLDAHLAARRFLIGDELTVADFSIGSVLNLAEAVQLPVQPYVNIARWHAQLMELPGWRQSIASAPTQAARAA